MHASHESLDMISWKSYKIIKKKATEKELSWSGLLISLSIAFFIVCLSAAILNLIYKSAEQSTSKKINSQQLIQVSSLARLFISPVSAATLDLKAAPVKDTEYVTLVQGQSSTQTIKIKNIGKDSWKPSEVTVETGPYLKTNSKIKTTAWVKYYQPVKLAKEVKSGQSIDITFPIKAPTDIEGTIQENFQLVRQERPINGSLIRVFVTINKSTIITPTPIVPIIPINNDSNPSSTIICAAMINDASAYQNCNTNSHEENSEGIIYQPVLNSEPIIRVGLFNPTGAQRITYDGLYDIYSGTQVLFSGMSANSIVTASFNAASKIYSASFGQTVKTASLPLRFIPRDIKGVATLLDYSNAPGWNPSVSDNRFRSIIEFRYATPANKVWVINELPLEYYVKGLAETTNASPVEFQKVMATAARSYALYHYLRGIEFGLTDASTKHANDHFHVDAYYDQVYRGYNSELRMPSLVAAVEATRGVAVEYNNKPVVTPYFSNSDGRTRDWTEVWGGVGMPWLKSVAVIYDQGKTLLGHGVGLSARGALLMVTNGQNWQTVLKYFYTGTQLFKIY
jgi:peptidoglycan hydrolase-like amidase